MHACQALAISCLDFRFQESLVKFLSKRHFRSYDLVTLAGGARNLVRSKNSADLVLNQIAISRKLHDIKNLYLINHQNCGAYGGQLPSGSDRERKVHRKDLKAAVKVVKKKFPGLKVYPYFMRFKKDPIKSTNFTLVK